MLRKVIIISIIFCSAAFLRLYGMNWDQGYLFHPDERFLFMTAKELKVPHTFKEYLDPGISTLNPFNTKNSFFVYGSFPLTLLKLLSEITGKNTYHDLAFFGRGLSAISDFTVVIIIFLLVWTWEKHFNIDKNLKYFASFFYSIAVFPLQNSHFFTVDSFLNLFTICTLYFSIQYSLNKKISNFLLSAVFFGLGIATKISVLLMLPLIAYFLFKPVNKETLAGHLLRNFLRSAGFIAAFSLTVYITARFADPKLFASSALWDIRPNQIYLRNLHKLYSYSEFNFSKPFPPAVQWLGTMPVIFALKNLVLLGVGIPYFLLSVLGLFFIFRKRLKETYLIVLWLSLLFIWQSSQFVKTMRYFYVFYPFLAVSAAIGLTEIYNLTRHARYKKLYMLLLFLSVMLWPLSFLSIYTKEHSRVSASKWINKNIPLNKTLAEIHWDDMLPVKTAWGVKRHKVNELPVFSPDTREKLEDMQNKLKNSDYIILSSNRGYGSLMPNKKYYPATARFFEDLFNNQKEFRLEAEFTSYPGIDFGFYNFQINDQWAEEAFTVYDHPKVSIFKKNG